AGRCSSSYLCCSLASCLSQLVCSATIWQAIISIRRGTGTPASAPTRSRSRPTFPVTNVRFGGNPDELAQLSSSQFDPYVWSGGASPHRAKKGSPVFACAVPRSGGRSSKRHLQAGQLSPRRADGHTAIYHP